jgi:hypothetical protein
MTKKHAKPYLSNNMHKSCSKGTPSQGQRAHTVPNTRKGPTSTVFTHFIHVLGVLEAVAKNASFYAQFYPHLHAGPHALTQFRDASATSSAPMTPWAICPSNAVHSDTPREPCTPEICL